MYHHYLNSPLGWLKIECSDQTLNAIHFAKEKDNSSTQQPEIMLKAIQQLDEYFQGKRKIFDLPVNPDGTAFQKKVWEEVKKITFGQTSSYLDIAQKTGSAKNTRAVGMANGKNPIPIIIPCHRIIGTNGKLTGYAGGVENKRWLLSHELKHSDNSHLLF